LKSNRRIKGNEFSICKKFLLYAKKSESHKKWREGKQRGGCSKGKPKGRRSSKKEESFHRSTSDGGQSALKKGNKTAGVDNGRGEDSNQTGKNQKEERPMGGKIRKQQGRA